MSSLHTTPLTAWHKAHGAVMASFAGWEMPLHYTTGVHKEHLYTRASAGLFDFSHMGEFLVYGKGAAEVLATIVTVNIDTLKPGRCRYGFMLNEAGGVKDDLIVYRLKENKFMLVVNAHTVKDDLATLQEAMPPAVNFEDISGQTAKIDLQGPLSFTALNAVLPGMWNRLPYFGFTEITFENSPLLVSRTGYTGELGVEIYVPWDKAQALWERIVADEHVTPVGLGARDTLRLEAGLPLYGSDLDARHTPAEAGFAAMLTSQAPYRGKEHAHGMAEKLIALTLAGNEPPAQGDSVFSSSGEKIGTITSSVFAPSLDTVIALAYVGVNEARQQSFTVSRNGGHVPAHLTTLPFYKKGTARAALM